MSRVYWGEVDYGEIGVYDKYNPTLLDELKRVGEPLPEVVVLPDPIQERFEKFDADHPEVYEEIKKLANSLLSRYKKGLIKYVSIAHIFEYMRAKFFFEGDGTEEYKMSNDFRSRYARKLIEEDGRFAGVIRLRELRQKKGARK